MKTKIKTSFCNNKLKYLLASRINYVKKHYGICSRLNVNRSVMFRFGVLKKCTYIKSFSKKRSNKRRGNNTRVP